MRKPAADLTPDDVVIRVVLHLPFLSGYASLERIGAGGVHIPRPLSFDLIAAGQGADLVLQNYSDELRAELSANLPHRVFHSPLNHPVDSSGPVLEDSPIVWHPRTLDVDFWNVGVGLVTATYYLEPAVGTPWSTVGPDVEKSRHVLKDHLAEERTFAVASVRLGVSRGELRRTGLLEDGTSRPTPQALWTHVCFLLEPKGAATPEQLDAVAERLTWGGAEGPHPEEMRNVSSRIGLDTAVGYFTNDAAAAASVVRMVGVHTVVWAAAVDLDRRLARLRRTDRPASLPGLQRQMAQTVAVYEHAQAFRTDLDAVAVHLSGLDASLWRAYAELWGLQGLKDQLSAVDARIEALQQVLTHAKAAITDRRAWVVTKLAFAFTVAGVINVFVGLVNLSSARLRTPSGVNLSLIVGLLILAVALWFLLWRVVLRSAERQRPKQSR